MKSIDLVVSAISNSFRSKTRTTLTVVAIFIGAFTLTLTSGVGTGINNYIDSTVSSFGASDVMTISKTADDTADDGPRKYDPDSSSVETQGFGPGATVEAITEADLDDVRAIDGVLSVDPVTSVSADYISADGSDKYELSIGANASGATLQYASGDAPTGDEIAIPDSLVDALGFSSADEAVGQTVSIGVTAADDTLSVIDATVSGVTEPPLVGGDSATVSDALVTQISELQSPNADSWGQATVHFDAAATDEEQTALKNRLADAGYTSTTVADQIGSFTTIIATIVLVLNAFAVIALLAAGFGIVNTLLMSVQERTREIGLMKAMGMAGRRIFALFSLEAVFIGFLGSAIGAGIAMIAGTALSGILSNGFLSALPGLTLVAFDPASIAVIILAVMGIAFLAGTIPAVRAARADPIESLRYE